MRSRVLVANSLVVAVGAVVGAWLTIEIVHRHLEERFFPIGFGFALAGTLVTLVVNRRVLRTAFAPLTLLERAAEAVSQGDAEARAPVDAISDPQIAHLAETFNTTLDDLAADRARVRELAAQTLRAQEDERKRIARELHDETAQILFAQLMQLTAFREQATGETAVLAERLEAMTAEALEGVRRVALELRPPALDDLGVDAALADLAQRFGDQRGITVAYDWRGGRGRLSATVELALYRVAQEALANVARHSGATAARLTVERDPHEVRLTVVDTGIGFDITNDAAGRLGIFGMRERIVLVGGAFDVRSTLGRGTTVIARIPIAPEPTPPGDHR